MNSDKPQDPAVILSDNGSFLQIVNDACDRLFEKKRELSIRRIQELERRLSRLEQELDLFLDQGAIPVHLTPKIVLPKERGIGAKSSDSAPGEPFP